MSSPAEAVQHHARQLFLALHQAYRQEGCPPAEARQRVGQFLTDLLVDWPAAEMVLPSSLSPLPTVRKALAESRQLGPQAASITRLLIDLQHLLTPGGKA